MEEAAHLGSEPQKSTFEVRGPAAALHAISHPHIVVVTPSLLYAYCFSVPCGPLYSVMEPPDNMYVCPLSAEPLLVNPRTCTCRILRINETSLLKVRGERERNENEGASFHTELYASCVREPS